MRFPFSNWKNAQSAGYSFITSDDGGGPTYAFTDISGTGTELDSFGVNEGYGTFDLVGFTFPFYGVDYTSIWVCNNGFIVLGTAPPGSSYSSDGVGVIFGGGGLGDEFDTIVSIGPFMKDLSGPADPAPFFYQEISDEDGNRCVIQWDGWIDQLHASGSTFTFQVILWESGMIQFVYETMTAGSGGNLKATIGIQETDASGLSVATIADGSALVHSSFLVQITP